MDLSTILNFVFGAGLVTTIIGLLSIRSELRRVRAEAKKAEAEADAVKITNTENATRILVQNIVEPLRQELDATRKELHTVKNEVARFRKAVEAIPRCPYHDGCPVLGELQKSPDGQSPVRTSPGSNTEANTRSGGRRQRKSGGKSSGGRERQDSDGSAQAGNLETDEPPSATRFAGEPEGEGQEET